MARFNTCRNCASRRRKCIVEANRSKCNNCLKQGILCEAKTPIAAAKKLYNKKGEIIPDVYLRLVHTISPNAAITVNINRRSTRPIGYSPTATSPPPVEVSHAARRVQHTQKSECIVPLTSREGTGEFSRTISETAETFANDVQTANITARSSPNVISETAVSEAGSPVDSDSMIKSHSSEGISSIPASGWAICEQFGGFEENIIKDLLDEIEYAIRDYSEESYWARQYYRDGYNDSYIRNPLKEWHVVDPEYGQTTGCEWFSLNSCTQPAAANHQPITAALRLLLGLNHKQKIVIPVEVENITFTQLHATLANWFVFDILSNKRDLYEFEKMKLPGNQFLWTQYLQSMVLGITQFGESGRNALREIRLRAWHTPQFKQALDENSVLQDDLIERLEAFLQPLTKIQPAPARSPTKVGLIKKTIELWSYLQAVGGRLTLLHPAIGDIFDQKIHSDGNFDDNLTEQKIWWVVRRGFRLEEECANGRRRSMMIKPNVFA